MAFSDLLERTYAEIYGEETFQFSLPDGNLLVEISNFTIALMALILAAVVIKVVAVCIEAQQQEEGEKALRQKIKKLVIVGIVAICIGGFTSVIAGYYTSEVGAYAQSYEQRYEHGGGGGYR